MKTPEEIKMGLESCNKSACKRCNYLEIGDCVNKMCRDALAYIKRLERERDAALRDIPPACGYCKHFLGYDHLPNCDGRNCIHISGVNTGWEWRGVCEENGGAEK